MALKRRELYAVPTDNIEDEELSALTSQQDEVENLLAGNKPTCLEDVIIQQEIAMDLCKQMYGADGSDMGLMQSVLDYLKSLRSRTVNNDPVLDLIKKVRADDKAFTENMEKFTNPNKESLRIVDMQDKIYDAPAVTPEGIIAQIDYLLSDQGGMEMLDSEPEKYMLAIRRSIENLLARAPITDPVITLWTERCMALEEFNSTPESDDDNYKVIDKRWSDADDKFLHTPAQSLEGVLLQVKALWEYSDMSEFQTIRAGIENIMKKQAA